jgi:hypothetical protein
VVPVLTLVPAIGPVRPAGKDLLLTATLVAAALRFYLPSGLPAPIAFKVRMVLPSGPPTPIAFHVGGCL